MSAGIDAAGILRLVRLPSELIHQICSNLEAPDLARLSRTCRALREHAYGDSHWKEILKCILLAEDMPSSPEPYNSYREMYMAHHPYWFIAGHRIWFSDHEPRGRAVLFRYNRRSGRIEGYELQTNSRDDEAPGHLWSFNSRVWLQGFGFKGTLSPWSDPAFAIPARKVAGEEVVVSVRERANAEELPSEASQKIGWTLSFCKDAVQWDDDDVSVWPPPRIPSATRVRLNGEPATSYADISRAGFRLARNAPPPSRHIWNDYVAALGNSPPFTSTWACLPPELYTPTDEKPYQGIYAGDYSGSHGVEFVLVLHVDKSTLPVLPDGLGRSDYYDRDLIRRVNEASARAARLSNQLEGNATGLSGALVGIKITGDPNVRRGEYTIVAPDIGAEGFVRTADEEPFKGARIVKSWGHVAEDGFQNDEYIPAQLIIMKDNKMAMYWMAWDHVAFYERLNIDGMVKDFEVY